MNVFRARGLKPATILGLALALAGTLVSRSPATPPSPPLEFSIELLESPRPGRPVRFAVVARPLVDAERLRIRVVTPRDCALVTGDTLSHRSHVSPGRTERLEYSVRIPSGLKRYVYVRAELETPGGHVYTRGENLVLLAGVPLFPEAQARPVPDGRGGTGLSFDGQPVPVSGRPTGPTPPGGTMVGAGR
ncbi:MAG: hypothetical protein ACREOU_07670 [Candidatus Eiseniibacteriota bacterium]